MPACCLLTRKRRRNTHGTQNECLVVGWHQSFFYPQHWLVEHLPALLVIPVLGLKKNSGTTVGCPLTTHQKNNQQLTGIGTSQPTAIGQRHPPPHPPLSGRPAMGSARYYNGTVSSTGRPWVDLDSSERPATGSARYHGTVSTTGRPWIDLDSSDSERDAVSTDFGRFDPPPLAEPLPPVEPLPPPPFACFSRLRNPPSCEGVPAP